MVTVIFFNYNLTHLLNSCCQRAPLPRYKAIGNWLTLNTTLDPSIFEINIFLPLEHQIVELIKHSQCS